MPTAFTDFHLTVLRSQERYSARVTSSPVGQAAVEFSLPFDQDEVQRLSWRAGFSPRNLHLIKAPATDTSGSTPLTLEDFGARLFDTLFAGEVGQLFFRSLDVAERNKTILRLQLQMDETPEVAELPWEFLYSRQLARFLALSTRTALVRYVGLPQAERTLLATLPLRLLAIVANPSDLPRLKVEEEWERLQQAVRELVQQGALVVERLEPATLAALRQRLRRQGVNEGVHILHFIGHGDFGPLSAAVNEQEGSLSFENEKGMHDEVSAKQLATLLHDHAALRLVYLNACHGASSDGPNAFAGVAQKLVQQGVATVLAMQFAVGDKAAITLAHEFYQSLTARLPLESAVSEARKALYSEGDEFEWGTPVLFSRSPDGMLLASQGEEIAGEATMGQEQKGNWWEQLDEEGTSLADLGDIAASGDVIIGVVGAGAKNVAVGKNITQHLYELLGPPTPDDQQVITQKFAAVDTALQQSAADAAKVQMAQGYLTLLRGELMKTGEKETPSASTITLVGSWLLDNVPDLLEALTSLFATPAAGRVVGKAGEVAVQWVKQRFGE